MTENSVRVEDLTAEQIAELKRQLTADGKDPTILDRYIILEAEERNERERLKQSLLAAEWLAKLAPINIEPANPTRKRFVKKPSQWRATKRKH